jgi:hypothetical protein
VGVLEPPLDPSKGQFHVRVAFRFHDQQWSAMPDHDESNEPLKLVAKFPTKRHLAVRGRRSIRPRLKRKSQKGANRARAEPSASATRNFATA